MRYILIVPLAVIVSVLLLPVLMLGTFLWVIEGACVTDAVK